MLRNGHYDLLCNRNVVLCIWIRYFAHNQDFFSSIVCRVYSDWRSLLSCYVAGKMTIIWWSLSCLQQRMNMLRKQKFFPQKSLWTILSISHLLLANIMIMVFSGKLFTENPVYYLERLYLFIHISNCLCGASGKLSSVLSLFLILADGKSTSAIDI